MDERGTTNRLPKVQIIASNILAASFFLSSLLNYILAKMIVVSQPGTEAYNDELGRMTALSYPVIMVPSMILFFITMFYLFSQLKKLTGLKVEDMLNDPKNK